MGSKDNEKAVEEDYKVALTNLHVNSKPIITFLTMLADENKAHAPIITRVVAKHIKEATFKLPTMYLIDSIVKNVGEEYKRLFGNSIASIFTGVFKEVDEKTRKKLYELRQTWNEVFPKSRLFHLDTNIHEIDPAWPITSQPRIATQPSTIHVNPNKFKPHNLKPGVALSSGISKLTNLSPTPEIATSSMGKTQDYEELQKLQSEKRVLEETRKKVEKMMKEKETTETPSKVTEPSTAPLTHQDRHPLLHNYKIKKKSQSSNDKHSSAMPSVSNEKAPNIHIAPWKAKQIMTTPSTTIPPSQKDPRIPVTARDPRLALTENIKEPTKVDSHNSSKLQRDPRSLGTLREVGPSSRDPRLANKSNASLGTSSKAASTPAPKPSPISTSKVCPPPIQKAFPPSVSKVSHIQTSTQASVSTSVSTIGTTTTTASHSHTLASMKEMRTSQHDIKKVEKHEKEKSRQEKDSPGRGKKEKDFSKLKDSLDPKKEEKKEKEKEKDKEKEKERDKHKEKERTKSKEREKDKKKQNENSSIKSSHEKKEEEPKTKSEKDIKGKKEGKDKIKSKKTPPNEPSKVGEHSSKGNNSSSSSNIDQQPKLKSDQSLSPNPDKFKSKNETSKRTKRREHIRPRIESPEEELKPETKKQALDTEKIETTNANSGTMANISIINGAEKRVKSGRDSDSEDSDHYDANKPRPSLYANKKAKPEIPISTVTPSTAKQTFETQAIDTDMRQLTSQPEIIPPPPKQTEEIVDLFGKEDVDLRQLSMPTHFPAIANNPAGNPFLGKPDEDMRIQPDHRKLSGAFQDNQNPRVVKLIESERRDYMKSPQREDMLTDINSRKSSFNSPQAAKWEKFREKNPEFKEYERQASSSEKMLIEGVVIELDDKTHSPRGGRGFNRRGRFKDSRRPPYREERMEDFVERERRSASPLEGHLGDENYRDMISQLNDQLKRGEISRSEFGRCMENIRLMVEQDKIRQLQAKEGMWGTGAAGVRMREERGAGAWSRQFNAGEGHHVDKFHGNKGDGKWVESTGWHRGRGGRGGPPTRGFQGNYRVGGSGQMHPRFDEDWTGDPDLPTVSEDVLRTVSRESQTRSIKIDNKKREIRTYGERAIILMDWNEPRRISFEPVQCDIVFDGGELVLAMCAGEGHREFVIDEEKHRVMLGVPTQELIIDGKGYQCFFGGKPITLYLSGKNRTVRLHGRPPMVNIGNVRDTEYLLGKIELIINAKKIIQLYLDAKPQIFYIDGMPFIIKFIDAFLAVNINGVKFPVIFGGLPISISVRGYRQFLRFSNLPAGVVPGQTTVKGMDTDGNTLIPLYPSSPPPPPVDAPLAPPQFNPPTILPGGVQPPIIVNANTTLHAGTSSTNTFSQGPLPSYPPQEGMKMPLGVVPSGVPPQILGIVPGSYLTTAEGAAGAPPLPLVGAVGSAPATPAFSQNPPPGSQSSSLDVQELLDRLVKTGIIGGSAKKETKKEGGKEGKEEKKENKTEEEEEDLDDLKDLPPIELMFNLDNLRKRNQKLIKRMYRGMQCSSCGLRYPPEQTQQYSHHLDWHFRMNKKQQESTKKVNTRKFYLCFDDWIQYEEIEDIEERVPSMFEVEGQMNTKTLKSDDDDDEEEIPSVAVSTDHSLGVCPICHETFDQFYHQNTEEWHYKYAIQVDGINYHPGCHQDLLKIQKQEEERLKKEAEEKEAEKCEDVEMKEDDIELEEVKVEDEEIQEIEKEIDTKPKEEIDLTAEDDKMDSVDQDEDAKRKQQKVTEALEKMRLLSNGLPPSYRIKEEQMDAEGEMNVLVNRGPVVLADLPVKVEIEDEPPIEPPSFDIEDDDVNESESGEVTTTTWIAPTPRSIAQTDIASSIDGNTELIINTSTSESTAPVPRIKISVSIPTQNNIEDQINANNHNLNSHNDDGDSLNATNHYEQFVPPPFTVDLDLKPAFRGVNLIEQPVALRGAEVSSLCSIM